MKKILLCLVFAFAGLASAKAQNYNWGIGVRGGVECTGISVKYNFDPANTIEGLVALIPRNVNFVALYERNIPVIAEGFNFYYGAGANIGSWRRHGKDKFTFGIDGVVGLEYKIKPIPLALAIDYKPFWNMIGHSRFIADDFGFSIRVVF